MSLRFRCLILDHDDTAVRSAAEIHHPAHVEFLKRVRPESSAIDVEGWIQKNFHPGIMAYLTEELCLNEEELLAEYRHWREYSTKIVPSFFPGFLEAIAEYRTRGGKISVVSHSEREVIDWHYRLSFEKSGVMPDLVFGWEQGEGRRKPEPWPVLESLRVFDLRPEEALIVDDLKPALLMSRATGVPIAAAGWGHSIEPIRAYMSEHCDFYLSSIAEFRELILSER